MPLSDRLIFQPKLTRKDPGYRPPWAGKMWEDVYFPSGDGTVLNGWFFPAQKAEAALLYLHGNAGNICDWADGVLPFVINRVSVLIVDYRGYGKSQGRPSEEGFYLDGQAAYEWLMQKNSICELPVSILGKSIGSAVACQIATNESPVCLILDSAFTSMDDVFRQVVPWFPSFMLPHSFQSLRKVRNINSPTLMVHGGADNIVPVEQAETLYMSLACPKVMKVVAQAGHNDIDSFRAYSDWIIDFIHEPLIFIDRNTP